MQTRRIAIIDRTLCNPEKCGYLCMKVCPLNRMKKECIVVDAKSEKKFPKINETLCIGCGICVKKCPMNAIKIVNLSGELQNPIHQYGPNSFRVYGMALPKEGAVVFIGQNGIGKTTMVDILSGQILPNFGNYGHEINRQDVLDHLSVEARAYFESIYDKNLSVSVKPQRIDHLTQFSGTVRELMVEIGRLNNNRVDEIVKSMDMNVIADRNVNTLSGGELQKVAIAVAMGKEVDITYFDEFTNYLDIRERLETGKRIRSLGESRRIIVVDHDLAVLDYIGDFVYVFYGEKNAYGVVSKVKGIRNGINEYINGYLKGENVKFRDYSLSFEYYSEVEMKKRVPVVSFPSFTKTYKHFNLSADAGVIYKSEIVGAVGRNALGKSTFMKVLSGDEKADSNVDLGVSIAYKPQYLLKYTQMESTVGEFLSNVDDVETRDELSRRLGISGLRNKSLSRLSGGELQAVVLTRTLSIDADIYLLDEPSAFMDIEQRLGFAHVLRQMISKLDKSAIVIDHDIVFLDAISNRIIVFDGDPSIRGHASAPLDKKVGMNMFLKTLDITMRRDKDTKRPRINKQDSVLDKKQKESGNYYSS